MLCRRQRRAIAILAAALLALLSTGWLAAPLIAWAQAGVVPLEHPDMRGSTVLIVLGDGTMHVPDGSLEPPPDGFARIGKAAALYRDCVRRAQRCTVIVSGGDPQHHRATEAAIYAPYLAAAGVARDDLILEPHSLTTYENAKYTTSILRSRRDDAYVLVTSSYQMRRALLDFARFGYAPQPVFADRHDAQCGLLPRWRNLVNAALALHELVGIAQFHVYRELGWF